MASTVYNGTNLLLKFIADGGTLATIGHSTSASLSLSMDAPEATSKDSADVESTSGYQGIIFDSDGFSAGVGADGNTTASAGLNQQGGQYLYMAFK